MEEPAYIAAAWIAALPLVIVDYIVSGVFMFSEPCGLYYTHGCYISSHVYSGRELHELFTGPRARPTGACMAKVRTSFAFFDKPFPINSCAMFLNRPSTYQQGAATLNKISRVQGAIPYLRHNPAGGGSGGGDDSGIPLLERRCVLLNTTAHKQDSTG